MFSVFVGKTQTRIEEIERERTTTKEAVAQVKPR